MTRSEISGTSWPWSDPLRTINASSSAAYTRVQTIRNRAPNTSSTIWRRWTNWRKGSSLQSVTLHYIMHCCQPALTHSFPGQGNSCSPGERDCEQPGQRGRQTRSNSPTFHRGYSLFCTFHSLCLASARALDLILFRCRCRFCHHSLHSTPIVPYKHLGGYI